MANGLPLWLCDHSCPGFHCCATLHRPGAGLHRRFHNLALVAVQRFRFDMVPLALLMAIVVTGLALTADSAWLGGAYYWYISLTHETVVVLWLISLPFGKFFHLVERPATVGIELHQYRVDVCPGAHYQVAVHLPLAWADCFPHFLHTARTERLAAQFADWSHDRRAGGLLQPGGHRPDGSESGTGRRGNLATRHRCRALARPDVGFDGTLQVAASPRRGNDADHFTRHSDQTLATAFAARCRGAAYPASACHQPAGGYPLSSLEPDQGKRGKLRIGKMRDFCHSA